MLSVVLCYQAMSGSPSSVDKHPNINGSSVGREEDLCAETPGESSYSDTILHSFVARNKILLAEVGVHPTEEVLLTAQDLLNRQPTVGWSASRTWRSSVAGLKFHVYEPIQGADAPLIWTFACVYDSRQVKKRQAQLFLEKLVSNTERRRFCNETWRHGGYHACKKVFSPTLLHCMQDVTCKGNDATPDDNLELSKRIINANQKIVHEFDLRKAKKETEKNAQERTLWKPEKSHILTGWFKPKRRGNREDDFEDLQQEVGEISGQNY